MKIKTAITPIVAVTALLLSTGNSEARGQNNIVRLAHSLQTMSKDIKNEIQTHYRSSRQYRHLMADANDLIKQANHIDGLSHDPRTSYQHIKTDLAKIDKLSHHLHGLVDRVDGSCSARVPHIHRKLAMLDNTVHAMQRAIIVYAQPQTGCAPTGISHYEQPVRPNRSDQRPGRRGGWNDWSRTFTNFFNY